MLGCRVLQAEGPAAGKAAADAAAAREKAEKKAKQLSKGKLILLAAEQDPFAPGRTASSASPPKTHGRGKVGHGDAGAPNPGSEAPGASDAAGNK